ncbi:MAG: hypothetical protein NZM07_08655 [Elioraea sp.]|nr:hypothetical protein [Elioraea sp.]
MPEPDRTVGVVVWRNTAFEPVAPLIQAFAALAGLRFGFSLSSYNSSLAFAEALPPAEVECVWCDLGPLARRSGAPAAGHWLADRLAVRRRTTTRPIVVYT